MNFYDKAGKMAIGSRLRSLSELITAQAERIYALYEVELRPKWFPVFYMLASDGERSITQIAKQIGHSHPSVSNIAKEMMKHGIVKKADKNTDGRENYVTLTEYGRQVNERIQAQYADVDAAVSGLLAETQNNIWNAISEWEYLLNEKSLLDRVVEQRKFREAQYVEIVGYHPDYREAFKNLNEEWITTWFKMEDTDHKYLDHPEENILNKGGEIFFALYNGMPAGTCALIKRDAFTLELSKMAVSPAAKGRGIGLQLGNAAITWAKKAGYKKLYLESNTVLKPAINLYHKLGFRKITGKPSPYERSNIQMELIL